MQARVYRVRPQDFTPSQEASGCYIEHEGKYLFLYRAKGKAQEHTWCVPGGKLEKNETPKEAVIREVFEETGITLNSDFLEEIAPLYVRHPKQDFIFHLFAAKLDKKPEVSLSDEHEQFCFQSFEEAMGLRLISGGKEAFQQFLTLKNRSPLEKKPFFFIRHGQTDANISIDKRVDYDLPLNETGKKQASLLKSIVQKLPVTNIHVSPIQRALETMHLFKEAIDLPHKEDPNLSECLAEVWQKMVQIEEGHGYEFCPLVHDFLQKSLQGLSRALKESSVPLIVAHGGIHWSICYHLQIENHPWKIGNCQVVHFEPKENGKWQASIID